MKILGIDWAFSNDHISNGTVEYLCLNLKRLGGVTMTRYDYLTKKGIDFEDFPATSDISVSKNFESPNGDQIRLIPTGGRSYFITNVGQKDGGEITVVVSGEKDSIESINWGGLWDKAKKAAGAIIDVVIGDGGGCSTTTTIDVGPGGKVTKITTVTNC